MHLSQRTSWSLSSNQISEILAQLRADGRRLVDLTESNPTQCGFSYPATEIVEKLNDAKNLIYEPCSQGLSSAREAVCSYYAALGIRLSPEQVFLTASTSEAYSFLFRLLSDPGDNILFPQPSYPLFQFLVDLNDLQMRNYRLRYSEDRWRLDMTHMRETVTPRSRAIVVVNPNNPTGSSFDSEEREALAAISRRSEIPLICDEVFLDYSFDSRRPLTSFLQGRQGLTFVLGGLSKALALPQMKLSWIILSGESRDMTEIKNRLEVIADTFLSVNTPVQNALPQWLPLRDRILSEVGTRVRENRRYIETALAAETGVHCLAADGGWYAVLSLPEKIDEEHFVQGLLTEEGVFVHPGYFFDFESGPAVVLSLLVKPELLQEGLLRILQQIKKS